MNNIFKVITQTITKEQEQLPNYQISIKEFDIKLNELLTDKKIFNVSYEIDSNHPRTTLVCNVDCSDTAEEFARFIHEHNKKYGYLLIGVAYG